MGNCSSVKKGFEIIDMTDVRKTAESILKYYDEYDKLDEEGKIKYDALIKFYLSTIAEPTEKKE